jgi:hypothetical protein
MRRTRTSGWWIVVVNVMIFALLLGLAWSSVPAFPVSAGFTPTPEPTTPPVPTPVPTPGPDPDPTDTPCLGDIRGTVTDLCTGEPGRGVDVAIDGATVGTDSNGVFSLSGVNPGEYFVWLPKIPPEWNPSSETVHLECDQTVWVDLFYNSCIPTPTPAPGVLPETGRAGPAPASVFWLMLAGAAVLGVGITLMIRQR